MSQDLLKIAISAALEAAKEILNIYQSDDFEVQLKSDDSPLTKADLVSHQVIESYLKPTNIPILSEEGKDISFDERKDWAQLWIVDPIDGTKEFIKRNGEFTVNIALIENQRPVIGVVYAPVLKELYFSSNELGGFKASVDLADFDVNNLIDSAVKLPLSREDKTYTIVASRSHLSDETVDFIEEIKKEKGDVHLISKGSSLKLCLVAEGSADCYPRFAPTMEWDTAAGQAICEHAGFGVIDWETKRDLLYNRPKLLNNWFVAK
ncbi:3'(2'),5'-bisphosphate nucleotidase CysQ [Flavobacteriales bacterium]|nr:3'(2'),5'-bisphosphate nucleotidase CysQ [Flavobacteriales bacterium]